MLHGLEAPQRGPNDSRKEKTVLKKIIFQKEEGIAVIRFNRPEVMNAYDMEMVEELIKAIGRIRNDDDTKVLIITGTGKAFCVGIDDHK